MLAVLESETVRTGLAAGGSLGCLAFLAVNVTLLARTPPAEGSHEQWEAQAAMWGVIMGIVVGFLALVVVIIGAAVVGLSDLTHPH